MSAVPGINLHLYPSNIRFESRMMRMTMSLAQAGLYDRIDLVGVWEEGLPEEETIDEWRRIVRIRTSPRWAGLGGPGRILQLAEWNRAIARRYAGQPVAAVNPHIVWALPVAATIKKRTNCPLIYDTHELETETIGSRGLRRHLSRWVERHWIGKADVVHVVSTGIEHWYREHYGLRNVHTIKNYPLDRDQAPATNRYREQFGIPADDIIFSYQGNLSRTEEIDFLLEAFAHTESDRHLVFMGFGPHADRLRELAAESANVHFQPGVPFEEVPYYTGSADVALVPFSDVCLSYHHVLPNKLLESLASGVPALVSDSPEMTAEIEQDDCGWILPESTAELAGLVNGLTRKQIETKKQAARSWALRCRWSGEAARMVALTREALGR